jgi:uncharacterized membrane protein YcaP (DUF421 family)
MHLLQVNKFTWKEFLLGSEEWLFLPEVLVRSVIMFAIILTSLALLGKRGVKQLSVFELVVIIGLGSAAGDPMFYKDVGVLPAILVFVVVICLYILVTYLVGKSKKVEYLVEGKAVYLIDEGSFAVENFKKEPLAQDEFFAELRLKGVSQLGQVHKAIIETNGGVSLFFYEDKDVKPGLPIMPGSLDSPFKQINNAGWYSCIFCGCTKQLKPASKHTCSECGKEKWVMSSDKKRVR